MKSSNREIVKSLALILSLIFIVGSQLSTINSQLSILNLFLHANIFHALANAWALLGIAFFLHVKIHQLITAAAVSVFVAFLYNKYIDQAAIIIGFSGAIYALAAILAYYVSHTRRWLLVWMASALLTLFLPSVAGVFHLLCFLTALLLYLPFAPIFRAIGAKKPRPTRDQGAGG